VQLLAANPSKRFTEILALIYSPLWMGIIGAAQLFGFFRHWSDGQHLAFGAALALPMWLYPLGRPPVCDQGTPFALRHSTRFNVLIALFSFLQCYFGSSLFFGAFGMQYHFHTRWQVNGTPLFLYLVTIAYFSTYYVLLTVGWRAFRTRFPSASPLASLVVRALLSYAVAFGETAAMATERMHEFFSYRDPRWVMLYGSFCYGTVFFVSLPLFYDLDERGAPQRSLRLLSWDAFALNMLLLVCYELYAALLSRL
jgi:cycloeucalenol cycloisomerase